MEINYTLFIQLGIYLALILILKVLFFDPILRLLNKRESLTSGKKEEALGMRDQVVSMKTQYEGRMSEVKQSMEAHRQEELRAVRQRAEQKMNDAKSKVERKLTDHQIEMEAEIKRLRSQLPQLSSDISSEIVKTLVHGKVVRA